jgi:hypothetical protein
MISSSVRNPNVRNGWKADVGSPPNPHYSSGMIYNIIDRRKRPYRWKRVNAVIEATSSDWNVDDSDEQPPGADDITYEDRKDISVEQAVAWATAESSPVTLYLYDEGEGI